MGDKLNKCVDCAGYMCEQTQPNGAGCIWAGTLKVNEPFRCIVCEPKHWKNSHVANPARGEADCFPVSFTALLRTLHLTYLVQYGFTGYGGRRRSKLTWPLVFASVSLSSLQDEYVQDALRLDLRNHFITMPENVRIHIRARIDVYGSPP